ncbi:unnamed protein product [Strongylus vulgaris]|uniref:C-type lectin domain-containing protein n=1 Tax=Strongylus vulgaris TaxID=40348 RepID=A0A3P7M2S4_STRVU|nr:unnamed protein product [Strongylus vulgaris]
MLVKVLLLTLAVSFCAADPCPPGYTCYGFVREQLPFEEARKACHKIGYELLVIHDTQLNLYAQQLSHLFLDMMYGKFWIGLNKLKGNWEWVDNTKVDFMNFARGNNPAKLCGHMRIADGKWVTSDCEQE